MFCNVARKPYFEIKADLVYAVEGNTVGFESSPDIRYCIDFYVTDGNIMYLTDASRFLISCVIQHYAPVVGWGGGGVEVDA